MFTSRWGPPNLCQTSNFIQASCDHSSNVHPWKLSIARHVTHSCCAAATCSVGCHFWSPCGHEPELKTLCRVQYASLDRTRRQHNLPLLNTGVRSRQETYVIAANMMLFHIAAPCSSLRVQFCVADVGAAASGVISTLLAGVVDRRKKPRQVGAMEMSSFPCELTFEIPHRLLHSVCKTGIGAMNRGHGKTVRMMPLCATARLILTPLYQMHIVT
jgi:hypothetical protein